MEEEKQLTDVIDSNTFKIQQLDKQREENKRRLAELYYDKSGQYRSQTSLFRKQQLLDLGFKRYEVIAFIKQQLANELFTRPGKSNSFRPKEANNQWHVDIAQLDNGQLYFVAVDTFSKNQAWRKIAGKDQKSVETAFLSIADELGMPASVFCDQEKSFPSLEKHTQVIVNHGGHAPMVERAIRTVKEKISLARFDGPAGKSEDLINEIVKKYNSEHIYEPTGMTPNEMARPENKEKLQEIYKKQAEKNSIQEPLAVGDEVRVAQKIQENEKKAGRPKWSSDVYEIKKIINGPVQTYQIEVENAAGRKKIEEFIRSDIKPAVATEDADPDYDPFTDPPKEPAVLKTVSIDPNSTFKPAEGSRRENKQKT